MRSLNAATANRRLICLEECPYGALKKNIWLKNKADYFDVSLTKSQKYFVYFDQVISFKNFKNLS